MVYYDGIHLAADTLDELHLFAGKVGLKREWFQNHPKHPHYDVWGGRNERMVLRLGATEVDKGGLLTIN